MFLPAAQRLSQRPPLPRRPATKMAATAAADLAALAAAPLGSGSTPPSLAGTSAAAPVFLTTQSCPYAARTWLALEESGLPFTPVFVDLKNKAEWHLQFNPYGRVPTLAWAAPPPMTAGVQPAASSLFESLVCNEFVNDACGGKLLPSDPAAAAGARLLIDQFFVKFGPAFGGLMFAEDGSDKAGEAAGKVDEALAWLERNTADDVAPGQGAAASSDAGAASPAPLFLLGAPSSSSSGGAPQFTLADAAIYPFVSRLSGVMPRLSPQSASKYADLSRAGFPRVAAWLARTAARPGVRRTEVAPAGTAGYWEVLEETYREYRARQRAAAAGKPQ